MTDCAHHDKSKYVDCATELLAVKKEVMKLRTAMVGKVLVDAMALATVITMAQCPQLKMTDSRRDDFQKVVNALQPQGTKEQGNA